MFNKLKSLIDHQGFKKYSYNAGWLMVDKLLRLFLGLFVGVWVARYLEPNNFGLLSFATSLVGLFGAIATLGLNQTVIRDLTTNPNKRDVILGTSFILKISGSIIMLILLFAVLQFIKISGYEKIIVMVIAFGQLFASFNVIDFYFISQVKAKFSGISNSIGLIIYAASRVIFILMGLSLIWFAVAVVIEQFAFATLFLFFYAKNNLNIFKWRISLDTVKNLLKDSWPLLFSGIAIMIYMRIDQVMIKEMMNNSAVGEYAAAVRLSEAWYFVPIAISQSVYPSLINSKKLSEKLYYNRLQKLFTFMVWLGIGVAIVMTFSSGFIINLLYGTAYQEASSVLSINIWAGVFVALGVSSGLWYYIENLQKYILYRTLNGLIINILLNLILIPLYGIEGSAIATVISQITAAYLFDFYSKKTRQIFYLKSSSFNPINFYKNVK